MSLRDQLQQTLGTAYTLDRELGGGGMSRVFVARDEALRRNVVVKVLPPELIAGVNVERFNREIELAAGLQHPHIVPVLAAGQMDGVPYYTMPYVDGESLRARLARAGSLPMTELIGYLRDVAKALAYAHERGVVHRDIKPDNVLISGGSATVTDFGIAKALAASKGAGQMEGGGTGALTSIGTSIGTPAYMAPEQAAGDPATDHRADIYSFGCLAFELLAGRPPFDAKTPQKLLAAHMGETPGSVSELRPETPPELADLVARCLAKDPNDRPQSASDIVRVLETVTSGGSHAAMPSILLGGRGMLKKALGIYVAAFLIVALVAKAAIVAVGLPDWVFPGALIVMALGLPIILLTAYAQYAARRAIVQTPTFTPGGTPSAAHGTMATFALKAGPHLSWRRTAMGGAWAIGVFTALIAVYLVLRGFGIGPFGSLLASGAVDKDEKILVADFPSPAGDSTIGPVVTDAFRTALGQSQSVDVLQQNATRDALRRMEKPATTIVDFSLAREIASREGIRAVVVGNLLALGSRYKLSIDLMSPQSGERLASFSENANSQSDLLPAIDKLAKELRARIGESLKNVQRTPPLEQVTTPSLEALKKYVAGSRLATMSGDAVKGAAMLEEAVALDTSFAMAYRKLSVIYGNRGFVAQAAAVLEKAYAHRDRLSDAERYLVTAYYYGKGTHQDVAKSTAAYEQLLDLQPNNTAALNNLGNIYRFERKYDRASELYGRAVRVGPAADVHYDNLAITQTLLNRPDSARRVIEAFAKAFPTNPTVVRTRFAFYVSQRQYDSVPALVASSKALLDADETLNAQGMAALADVAKLHGKIGEGRRLMHEAARHMAAAGVKEAPVMDAAEDAFILIWFFGDTAQALREMDDSLARHPLDAMEEVTDPFVRAEMVYAAAGRSDKAKAVVARWEQARKKYTYGTDSLDRYGMLGDIDMGAGHYDAAVKNYLLSDQMGCNVCTLPFIGRAYDLAGNTDSTIAVFNRYLSTPEPTRNWGDGMFLAGIHKRLGELYEAKGDRQNAISHYTEFVQLWKDADAPLQPKVTEAKAKIARLSKVEGKN